MSSFNPEDPILRAQRDLEAAIKAATMIVPDTPYSQRVQVTTDLTAAIEKLIDAKIKQAFYNHHYKSHA